MKISSIQEMRTMDKTAMTGFGIPEELLMENAALAAVSVMRDRESIRGGRILILCGPGNNGGDGLAAGRKLHSLGEDVEFFIAGDAESFRGAAKLNMDIVGKIGLPVTISGSAAGFREALFRADAVIDALFGTGLSRNLDGTCADIIRAVNESGKPVISLDIPSGIHGDTGQVLGCAVKAVATVTFGLPKYGNLLYPGAGLCGRLYVSRISFPKELYEGAAPGPGILIAVNEPLSLPPRDPSGHKGSFGDALFIAGASGYYGAPYLAAMGMLKAGGGYSRLAAPRAVCDHAALSGREIVCHPMDETEEGSLALNAVEALAGLTAKADFTVLGPGLSLAPETRDAILALAGSIPGPLLIDGDALTVIAPRMEILADRKYPTLLTPHGGEFARIMGVTAEAVESDRIGWLKEAIRRFSCHILLKGAHSLVGFPDGKIFVNLTGNDGMATAGAGDVLTGAVAAMYVLAPGSERERADAALRNGAFVHGLAGDIAAAKIGKDGMTASDILACLPEAVGRLRAGDWQNPIAMV